MTLPNAKSQSHFMIASFKHHFIYTLYFISKAAVQSVPFWFKGATRAGLLSRFSSGASVLSRGPSPACATASAAPGATACDAGAGTADAEEVAHPCSSARTRRLDSRLTAAEPA